MAGNVDGAFSGMRISSIPRPAVRLAFVAGTDLVLFYAWMTYIADKGWVDKAFIDASTTNFDEMRSANKVSLEDAAKLTGLTVDQMRKSAEWIAQPKAGNAAGARCSPTRKVSSGAKKIEPAPSSQSPDRTAGTVEQTRPAPTEQSKKMTAGEAEQAPSQQKVGQDCDRDNDFDLRLGDRKVPLRS